MCTVVIINYKKKQYTDELYPHIHIFNFFVLPTLKGVVRFSLSSYLLSIPACYLAVKIIDYNLLQDGQRLLQLYLTGV